MLDITEEECAVIRLLYMCCVLKFFAVFFSFCPNVLNIPFISVCELSVCTGNFKSLVRPGITVTKHVGTESSITCFPYRTM